VTNPQFEAIIFDHDGTLVDTESPDFEACTILCREQGIELSLEYWAENIVGHMDGYTTLFNEQLHPANPHFTLDNMWQRLHQLWEKTLEHTQLMPGVETLLPHLRKEGYKMGVATAADRDWANRWLTRFNLLPYFQTVATGQDVTRNKPAPDVYLLAAELLGANPARCLVFEDSVAGASSARAAGMTVVAVPSPITQSLDFSVANHTISGLQNVSAAWIEQLARTVFGNGQQNLGD